MRKALFVLRPCYADLRKIAIFISLDQNEIHIVNHLQKLIQRPLPLLNIRQFLCGRNDRYSCHTVSLHFVPRYRENP